MIQMLAVLATLAAKCPVEGARYVLRGEPSVEARFRPVASSRDWPSGLALGVTSKSNGLTWWLPWLGGTDNLQNIASTTDVTAPNWSPPDPDGGPRPFGNRQFIATDAGYDVVEIPSRGHPAPAHMLIPEAGSAHDDIFVSKQFFDFAGCSSALR